MEKQMKMRVDGELKDFPFVAVAFDGCHKLYLCEDEKEVHEAEEYDYEIHEPLALPALWERSCPLKFVSTWRLDAIIEQCAEDYGELTIEIEEA